jgi:DNA-binding NtrC family response regulator
MLKKILIVDDEESMRLLYRRVFSGVDDCSFTLAGSLAEASALLKAMPYDLLITDLLLGDGHGTELIELARARHAGTKVIIVSGSVERAELTAFSEKYSLSGCFCKPFSIEALLRAVKEGTEQVA